MYVNLISLGGGDTIFLLVYFWKRSNVYMFEIFFFFFLGKFPGKSDHRAGSHSYPCDHCLKLPITKIYFVILTTCQTIVYNNMSLFTTRCQNSNSKITQLQCCQVPLELAPGGYLSFQCLRLCFVYLFACFYIYIYKSTLSNCFTKSFKGRSATFTKNGVLLEL